MITILVIEDDIDSRTLIVDSLKNDYTLLQTGDSVEALGLARECLPDIILCDITLPQMDGFEVLQALRQDEKTQGISFIFLTGTVDQATVRLAMNMGADDYIAKPFKPSDLREAVKARLNKRAAREAQLRKRIEELRQNITLSLPHELRTAIMVIEGYAYLMMQDKNGIEPDQYEMLQSISDYASRLHVMAEKFLWYCKTQVLVKDETPAAFSVPIDSVIHTTAVETAMRLGRAADIELEVMDGVVQANEEYIEKIVGEVVENAFKFSASPKRVSVVGRLSDGLYTITIKDEGRGMTEDQIQGIGGFIQFDRLAQEQQGTGLGLIIAKRLAELCGGHLQIESRLNHGTTVTIALPVCVSVSPHMAVLHGHRTHG
jgi:two-component system, sensor histidine kinase and response regulator